MIAIAASSFRNAGYEQLGYHLAASGAVTALTYARAKASRPRGLTQQEKARLHGGPDL
jgi:hypothetical protein